MATSLPASPLFLAPPGAIDAVMAWGEAEYLGDIWAHPDLSAAARDYLVCYFSFWRNYLPDQMGAPKRRRKRPEPAPLQRADCVILWRLARHTAINRTGFYTLLTTLSFIAGPAGQAFLDAVLCETENGYRLAGSDNWPEIIDEA
jgi:hypothetical protein